MRPPADIRALVDQVTSFPTDQRERIYRKHFANPNATVRFLCEVHGLDRKRVLDVCCHYGYHLIHFGEGSQGIDGSPQYLKFANELGLSVQLANIEENLPEFSAPSTRCRSEEHTSELQSRRDLVCRLLLEKKKI